MLNYTFNTPSYPFQFIMHISSSTPASSLSMCILSLTLHLHKRSLLLADNSFHFQVVWANQQISLAAASTAAAAALAMR